MRLPPVTRQTLTTLSVSLWAILVGGVRIFAWDSLKHGFIDVRPLPRVAREGESRSSSTPSVPWGTRTWSASRASAKRTGV